MRVRFLTSIASAVFHYSEGDEADVAEGAELTNWLEAGICEPVVDTPAEAAIEPPPEAAVLPAARSHKRKHHQTDE
jgi:hypothetical protein